MHIIRCEWEKEEKEKKIKIIFVICLEKVGREKLEVGSHFSLHASWGNPPACFIFVSAIFFLWTTRAHHPVCNSSHEWWSQIIRETVLANHTEWAVAFTAQWSSNKLSSRAYRRTYVNVDHKIDKNLPNKYCSSFLKSTKTLNVK